MWRTIAKVSAWFYIQGAKTKAGRNKRRVEIDAKLSRAWDSTNGQGWGNREYFTVSVSKFFSERGDIVQIDEFVDFVLEEHFYVIRPHLPKEGATSKRKRRQT